ncbi:LOW QUALITY PROTEIN: hypothetical protein KUTeg_018472 [Tegillarca granosa]|uniref:PAS domain-containing protein n=1 Tax=Tegillarca granosa TaxID=220873 RepID=A0ABQ9EJD7_TEGGR|nr:LOW QUALITY PROTEIN: hypothetical protein KUTeg_018472 [Tegillarca granosa]
MNELLSLEYGEVRLQLKLQAVNAVFAALDSVSDAVEISNEDHEIEVICTPRINNMSPDDRNRATIVRVFLRFICVQNLISCQRKLLLIFSVSGKLNLCIHYINHACERLTGYNSEEIAGKNSWEVPKNDKNKADLPDTINGQLRKGKYWEGTYYTRRKSGEIIPSHCHFSPVMGPGGKLTHIISVKNSTVDTSQILDRVKDCDYNMANGGIHGVPRRRESIARIHSMTIEAPITKVINIINSAQESSPITVVQALDKVLEILRTSFPNLILEIM